MSRHRIPSYRCYKPKNLGLVVLGGKAHYLGKYGTPESWAEYHRLVKGWLEGAGAPAVPPQPPATALPERAPTPSELLVNELILAFLEHASGHYVRPDGSPTGEMDNFRSALSPLREMYGYEPAGSFGPLALRAVRDRMADSGLCRTTINARVNRIRHAFRWAASNELIPASVVQALETVPGLQRGRSRVRESDGVSPVPVGDVEATIPFLPAPVAAMVRLQLLTGCRPGEVLIMRGADLATEGPTWIYRPSAHKNSWRSKPREIHLGPRAQEVVRGFLSAPPDQYLFSPRDAVAGRHALRGEARRSRPTPSERAKKSPRPGSSHAPRYDRRGYRQAIVRAAARARVATWSPLQLRHTAATQVRAKYGLEAAQLFLGHEKADVTQIYAERDAARVREIASAIG